VQKYGEKLKLPNFLPKKFNESKKKCNFSRKKGGITAETCKFAGNNDYLNKAMI
jgi:hypothetical protein